MKINSLDLKHFESFVKAHVQFDKKRTYLIGPNGKGKTTAGLTGLWFALQSISQKSVAGSNPIIGERYRFIHKDFSSAEAAVEMVDDQTGEIVTVTRKMTADKVTLTIHSTLGRKLDQKWLDNLFNIFMLSPARFTEMSPTEQVKALGVDVSPFTKELAELKTNFTVINKQLSDLGTLPEDPIIIEPKDLTEINARLKAINDQNLVITNDNNAIKEIADALGNNEVQLSTNQSNITDLETQIFNLQQTLQVRQTERTTLNAKRQELLAKQQVLPSLQMTPLLPTAAVQTELDTALNATTFETDAKLTNANIKKRDQLRIDLANNKQLQSNVGIRKNEYLAKCNLGVDGLVIDEDGQLTYLGRFIKKPHFSAGELIKIVAALVSRIQAGKSDADALKYMFIEEFNLLDKDNQAAIIAHLEKLDFQLVIEYVGEEGDVDENNYIILTENLTNGSN